jgi:hypothetical protein
MHDLYDCQAVYLSTSLILRGFKEILIGTGRTYQTTEDIFPTEPYRGTLPAYLILSPPFGNAQTRNRVIFLIPECISCAVHPTTLGILISAHHPFEMNSRKTTCYPRPHRDHRRIDTATFPDIRTQSPLDHHLYPLSFVHDRSQEDPLTIQPRHPTNGVFRYRWSVGGVVREVLDNWLALRGETAVQHSFILCVILSRTTLRQVSNQSQQTQIPKSINLLAT